MTPSILILFKLPDSIKDIFSSLPRITKSGIAALNAHCRRELFQSCWNILLDAEFLHAYRHGIVLQCPDGIFRRVFPRIFTYSADYPEKCVICPLCFSYKYLSLLKGFNSNDQRHGDLPVSALSHAKSLVQSIGHLQRHAGPHCQT